MRAGPPEVLLRDLALLSIWRQRIPVLPRIGPFFHGIAAGRRHLRRFVFLRLGNLGSEQCGPMSGGGKAAWVGRGGGRLNCAVFPCRRSAQRLQYRCWQEKETEPWRVLAFALPSGPMRCLAAGPGADGLPGLPRVIGA